MCGICGFVGLGTGADISEMCRSLGHRGPDEWGQYVSGDAVLGHTRLRVIDLDGGRQPLSNEDGSIWVVFNGEIYNYLELRDLLARRGHRLRGRGDTEVIVHLYEEFGERCLEKMKGMFAFALWDSSEKKLLLARDRLGIKPLYYAMARGGIVFSSELKAMRRLKWLDFTIDPQALHDYLTYKYVPAPMTIFRDIQKLMPGHALLCRRGEARLFKYWDVNLSKPPLLGDEDELAELLREKLQESVKRHLASDVPVGAFLSGGIDSSAIVALMREAMAGQPLMTFSIGFAEKAFDELPWARITASHFSTVHHEATLSASDAISILNGMTVFDEPFADPSALPTYFLSGLARKHVTVILSGDGGDELFAGYDTYRASRIATYFSCFLPLLKSKAVGKAIEILPSQDKRFPLSFKGRKFISGMELRGYARHLRWMEVFSEEAKKLLYNGFDSSELRDSRHALENYGPIIGETDELTALQYLDLKVYLPDDILVKLDRASMAHSLEARVPFLDDELVELAFSIPPYLRMKGLRGKYLLRKALGDLVPQAILKRPKRGFSVPISAWLKSELKPLLLETLTREKTEKNGFFNYEAIKRMMEAHWRGESDFSRELWVLLAFEIWRGEYL